MRSFVFCTIFGLLVLVPPIVSAQQQRPTQPKKPTVAVLDFEARGGISKEEAASLSDAFQTQLFSTNGFIIVDRNRIKAILTEQGFQQSGCTDVACAVKIGILLSARKMLVGSIIKLGTKLIISGRVIDVERGVGEKGAKGIANSVGELDAGVTEFINNL